VLLVELGELIVQALRSLELESELAFMLPSRPCGRQMLERERERVADASRRLAAEGLVVGTAGNVSERAGALVAITPSGAVLRQVEARQVAVIDLDGVQHDGELAPTSELALHLGVYKRYEAGAVVHTHAPVGTALSCVLDELPVVHYQMLLLGGPIRVAPYAVFGSAELAELTLDALRDRSAALMANHGTIAYGSNLSEALEQSLLLEWSCTLYWRAAALGSPRTLDQGEQLATINAVLERGYGPTHKVAQ
jgi:L-fuculose-phosphate aldolase